MLFEKVFIEPIYSKMSKMKFKKRFKTFLKLKVFNNLHIYIVISLLIYGIFSRFWKLYEFFTFNFDEEYQALLAWEQVKHFHRIWIGVSASTVNYYLGPGITYLNALLFKINKNPVILGYFGSFLGILTIISIYYVTKKLFTQKTALFASAFYTGSLFINYFDRRFWNDSPIPIISILMYYGLMKMEENSRWLIFCVFLMGISLHIHLSLLAFWPVIILLILLNFKKTPLFIYLKSLIIFLIVTFPLLVFDFVHNFDNMLMPLRYIKIFFSSHHEGNFTYSWQQLLNTLSRIWYLHPYTNVQDEIQLGVHGVITQTYFPLSLFSLLIIFWLFYKSIHNTEFRILVFSMFCFIVVYLFYPGGVVAYFLLGFIALFAIAVGIFFEKLPFLISIPIIIIFMTVNLYSLLTTQQEQYGLLTRKKLIQKIMPAVGNKSFYLETRSIDKRQYHSMGGWRYLFKAYGKTPSQSHADTFFSWIYTTEVSNKKPLLRVIISEYPTKVEQKIIAEDKEGVYYGFIINNE
jgi:4-amino-4-deoxy-L-arabinose transferase-like glycosyltransferase